MKFITVFFALSLLSGCSLMQTSNNNNGGWHYRVDMGQNTGWTQKFASLDASPEPTIKSHCTAGLFQKPEAIKIIYKDGREEITNCDEYNKTNPKKD